MAGETLKIPPQNIEAEQSVLGSMLLEEEAIGEAIEALREEYFYQDAHKKIFSAICKLYETGRAVDLITLREKLKKDNQIKAIGGVSYLTRLTEIVPSASNVKHYARIVKEKAILRILINTSTNIISDCYDESIDADQMLDRAERNIFDIAEKRLDTKFVSLKDIVKDSIKLIDDLYQRKAHVTGIPTGFNELDVMTAGLQSSDLIVVAGRPSMGKSALATCLAEHAAIVEKVPTAIFSLEMSKEQLVQRMLCSRAGVDLSKVRSGYLSQEEWPQLTNAAGVLSEAPIYIDDTPAISALELRAKARRLKAKYNIGLIVLDYLQLMQGPARAESRQQEISEISRGIKALARELNLPLIAVSQLSRATEARPGHRPQLSDLRESGAIEQDADVVMLLLREEYYNPTPDNKGKAEVIIAKQRNGPVGSKKLAFLKEYVRFADLSPREG